MQKSRLQSIENQLKKLTHKVNCTTQFHDSTEDFPEVGSLCSLYVDKSTGAVYVYDEDTQTYITADPGGDVEFSLTTTGTSGPATLVGTVLNIPQYQAALTNPITGTGVSGQVSYWTGTNTQGGSAGFIFDAVNQRVGIGGVASPSVPLEVKGTTVTDGGQLGAELLTSSNWTTTGWTGDFVNGFSHNTGNTDVLSNTLAAVVNTYYQITWTVTNRTAGTFTVAFGGQSSGNQSATGNFGPRATTTGNLTITPTTDFDGTVVISIKVVTAGTATFRLQSSAGTITNEVRSFTSNTNTAVGLNAGSRITTGGSNSFFGRDAGTNNTTGANNSFFGRDAGTNNTTGSANSFFGVNAGLNNTTGANNSFFGLQAGQNNTTGANNSFFGQGAGLVNTTGFQNSFFGSGAGGSNTTGIFNSFFGRSAGQNNTTGANNSFFGVNAGLNNTTGGSNSFFGQNAAFNNTTGSNNSFFGYEAGRRIANGSNLTVANNSVFLGWDTRAAADSQTNQTVIGYSAIGLGSNTTVIGNSSTTLTWLGGSTSIGTTDSSARLHVRGSGTTSSTTALLVQNSTPSDLFKVQDDGVITIGTTTTIFNTGSRTTFSSLGGANVNQFRFTTTNTLTSTSGTVIFSDNNPTFNPTSGTATLSIFNINPTINQTGGANGITRGLYVNPTLTAAADWRGIEISTGATNTVVLGKNTGSAAVEVTSTTQGFLPPRMTTAQRDLIATPAAGLVIFNTSTTKLECFDGAVWQAAW